jgi:hypothetical protein
MAPVWTGGTSLLTSPGLVKNGPAAVVAGMAVAAAVVVAVVEIAVAVAEVAVASVVTAGLGIEHFSFLEHAPVNQPAHFVVSAGVLIPLNPSRLELFWTEMSQLQLFATACRLRFNN